MVSPQVHFDQRGLVNLLFREPVPLFRVYDPEFAECSFTASTVGHNTEDTDCKVNKDVATI